MLGSDGEPDPERADVKDLPAHADEEQVQLDVNRSFVYYPEGMSALEAAFTARLKLTFAQTNRKSRRMHAKSNCRKSSWRLCAVIPRCTTSKAIMTLSRCSYSYWASTQL